MAKAVINLQKESGGIVKISPIDGIGVTEVTVPESGNLVSVGTVVTDNAIARFDGTTGKLQDSGIVIDDRGIISGSAVLQNFNDYSTTGRLLPVGAFGLGALGAESILNDCDSIEARTGFYGVNGTALNRPPNIGTSAGMLDYKIWTSSSGLQASQVFYTQATIPLVFTRNRYGSIWTDWVRITNLDSSGNLLLTSGTGALGYGTGAGGTVTQLTSKSTAVTLNKPTGKIIINNSSMAAGATVGFALNNSLIGEDDKVEVEAVFGAVYYNAYVYFSEPGVAYIAVENKGGSERTDALAIKFVIIKGATA